MNLNSLENIFVIGDIHGCYYTLKSLIKQFPSNAQLIFVGDLCDKGNYSKEVIEFVKSNNYLCVKGNHEQLFEEHIINAVENKIDSPWSINKKFGGYQCIESYKGEIEVIKDHLKWIKTLPIYLQIDKYFITHGFALKFFKAKENKKYHEHFLWTRLKENTHEPKVEDNIINIFGHCIFDEVQFGNKYICLDTGCVKGNKLSAIQLGTNRIFNEPMDYRDSTYLEIE